MRSIFCATPYHQQDTATFCGLAVAEMFLARFGTVTLEQLELEAKSLEPVRSDGISLEGMLRVLTAKRPDGFDSSFMGNRGTDREAAIKLIVDALFATRLPVPVLIFGRNAHWVLITGAVIDDAAGAGSEFELHGFYLANPAPVTAALVNNGKLKRLFPPPPPQHRHNDHCGDGGLQGGRYVYVSAASWRRHYWPAPDSGERPRPFVSITTAHVPSQADILAAPIEVIHPPLTANSPISNESAASAAAKTVVHGSGIDKATPFGSAFIGAEPVETTRHDVVGGTRETWFLVTFKRGSDTVAAAFVESASGQLMGAMAPVPAVATDAQFREYVFQKLALRSNEFADLIGGREIALDEIDVEPVRFWRPCFESTSPFQSFARVRITGKELYVLYQVGMFSALSRTRCTPGTSRPVGPSGLNMNRS